MNDSENKTYNPAEDENQGVITKLTQGDQAGAGTSQAEHMSSVVASGPESEKAEVNESDAEGVNNDMLAQEDVENGEVDTEEE